jgi:hypothetical protein
MNVIDAIINTIIIINTFTQAEKTLSVKQYGLYVDQTTNTIHKTHSIKSKRAVRFEKVGPHMYGGLVDVEITDIRGDTYTKKIAVRLDGRDVEGYRVDVKSMAVQPWEAIDGGYPFKTLKDAKRFASAWLKA